MRGFRVLFATVVAIAGAALPAACQDTASDGPAAARTALLSGDYQRALVIYRALATQPEAEESVRWGLVRALRETGAYREAEMAARQFVQADSSWLVPLAELVWLQGRRDEADRLFRAGLAIGGPTALRSGASLGWLLLERGDQEEAERLFAGVIRLDPGRGASADDLLALARAFEGLGARDANRFRDALRVYDEAIAADPENDVARIALGRMFLARFNRPDALESFEGILQRNPHHPEALLGKALVAREEGRGEGPALLTQALEVNPRLVGARVAVAMGHLEREDYPAAAEEAGRGLTVDSGSLEALTVLAASQMMAGDSAAHAATARLVFTINPRYARFYADLAELSARNRFYRRAVELGERGVALDSLSPAAFGALGLNELRIGRMAEGRRHLERAFALDPFNVWIKNTLDMLDVFGQYREIRQGRLLLYASAEEADLLSLYLSELLEEAYDSMATRYHYRPSTPIQLEVYRYHSDFSVRTVGLAGLGALGVSFGNVLAMDSPQARERGAFNWGSTFWHELAHAFTLGVTDHRVPRWFSEGLSVLEERRARPGWGARATVGFLRAAAADSLLPVSRLNDGFVRPTFPEQVGFSYFQASLVCEMIETTRGPEAINAMLDGYRRGLSTAEVFQTALDLKPEALDREFDSWFRGRYRDAIKAVEGQGGGAFQRELRRAVDRLQEGDEEQARQGFERAKALFPDYAEGDSPSWHLALLHRKAGRLREAARELNHLTSLTETDYQANDELGSILEALGDTTGAAKALERAIYVDPREITLHQRLAGLYVVLGEWPKAVRERRAVVALAPPDRAEAYYQLALAWYQAGDLTAARREVLRSLDVAPAYEAAQDLLLRIRSGPPKG